MSNKHLTDENLFTGMANSLVNMSNLLKQGKNICAGIGRRKDEDERMQAMVNLLTLISAERAKYEGYYGELQSRYDISPGSAQG